MKPLPPFGGPRPVTVESVEHWTWTTDDDHRGRIPVMYKHERQAWSDLYDILGERKLTTDEDKLLWALCRKLNYRADREIDW